MKKTYQMIERGSLRQLVVAAMNINKSVKSQEKKIISLQTSFTLIQHSMIKVSKISNYLN